MLFNSWNYIFLLLLTCSLYWMTTRLHWRRILLMAASVFFYCSWNAPYILLFFLVMAINWHASLAYEKTKRKYYVTFAVVSSLGILFLFKYTNFLISNINSLTKLFPTLGEINSLNLILPLGISFYTFQAIGYTVDVYREEIPAEKSYFSVCLFLLFFPHHIAGPICRATQLLDQLAVLKKFDTNLFIEGLFALLGGFVLKSCFADAIAPYVNVIFAKYETLQGSDLFLGMLGFGLQIFGDFWGYSLMAIGSAKLFGYVVPFNFDLPYFSLSIQDFWRRWHMSLSSWLRDYVYIPLGGSRGQSTFKTYRNLFLTMFLGGLWHGANWTFVVWGSIHGFTLSVHKAYATTAFSKHFKKYFIYKLFAALLTLIVVFISWIFFRAPNVSIAFVYIARMCQWHQWGTPSVDPLFFELCLLFLPIHIIIHHYTFKQSVTTLKTIPFIGLIALLTLLSLLYYVSGQDFIYFQF